MMEHITAQTFDPTVLQSDKPVLVDFWATWCAPCQMLAPVLEEIEAEHPELLVAKVNVDESADLAIRYRVSSIPALLLFRDGKLESQMVGYADKATICKQLGL